MFSGVRLLKLLDLGHIGGHIADFPGRYIGSHGYYMLLDRRMMGRSGKDPSNYILQSSRALIVSKW